MDNKEGLRILSLDGGGIRGLSSLMILKELMNAINSEKPPKPCDVFDMICGTSTGGLIAIMLGRLGMSVEECIQEYRKLGSRVFSSSMHRIGWKGNRQGRFSATALEESMKDILVRHGHPPDALLTDPSSSCFTFVCATSQETLLNQNLCSWELPRQPNNLFNQVKIWEAARATSAASTFFDPIEIGGLRYVDGGIGYNNPIAQAYREALNLWSGNGSKRSISVIVSIGTGLPVTKDLNPESNSIVEALTAIATDAEGASEKFAMSHRKLAQNGYFRFNVSNGVPLEEWRHLDAMFMATRHYFDSPEQIQRLECLASLLGKQDDEGLFHGQSYPRLPVLGNSQQPLLPGLEGDTVGLNPQQQPDAAFRALDQFELELFSRFRKRGHDGLSDASSDSGYHSSDKYELFQDEFITRLIQSDGFLKIWQLALERMHAQAFHTALASALQRYATELIDTTEEPFNVTAAKFVGRRCEELARLLWFRIRERYGEDEDSGPQRASEVAPYVEKAADDSQESSHGSHGDVLQSASTPARQQADHTEVDPMLDTEDPLWQDDINAQMPQLAIVWAFLTRGKPFRRLQMRLGYMVSSRPLHLAVMDDNSIRVCNLLEQGFDISTEDSEGKSVLDVASDHASVDTIRMLLKYNSSDWAVEQTAGGLLDKLTNIRSSDFIENRTSVYDYLEKLAVFASHCHETPRISVAGLPYLHGDLLILNWELPKVLSGLGRHCDRNRVPQEIGVRDVQIKPHQIDAIGRIVTITGSEHNESNYEAATCEEYLRKHYGYVGLEALETIKAALRDVSVVNRLDLTLSPFFTFVRASKHYLIVHCRQDCKDKACIKGALIWICQALRTSLDEDNGALWISSIYESMQITAAGGSVMAYTLEPLRVFPLALYGTVGCWTELFEAGVVASQPTPRTWGRGLELSFSMMVHLAAVHNYLWIEDSSSSAEEEKEGGYIMIGFFTALIPVAQSPDGHGIQWHLESTGDRLVDAQNLTSLRSPWLKIKASADLENSICYLGWCESANILLGTDKLEYNFCWTDLKRRSRTLHRKGYGAIGQASIIAGPIQIVGQGSQDWEFVSNRQRFSTADSYAKAIQVASRQVALVFDAGSERAWLVPKLSLMLHLCHMYFRNYAGNTLQDPIPFAQPSSDGSNAAVTALFDKGDVEVFKHGSRDVDIIKLRNVLIDISANLTNTLTTRENPRNSVIFGAELMDVIVEPGAGGFLSEVPANDCAKTWICLARLVDCIGVCADLGPAIKPVSSTVNCDCKTVQPGRGYLAAHLWCLDVLLQRQRHHINELQNSTVKIGKDDEWRLNPFSPCPHLTKQSYWDEPQNFLQSISSRSIFRKEPPQLTQPPPLAGAVIFGRPPPNRLTKKQ